MRDYDEAEVPGVGWFARHPNADAVLGAAAIVILTVALLAIAIVTQH